MISDNKKEEQKSGEEAVSGTTPAETLAQKRAARRAKAKQKSKKRLFVIIPIAIVILAVLGFFGYKFFTKPKVEEKKNTEEKVTRGSIVNVIEGSGTIEANAQYEVKYLNSVDVVADYFKEGDYVKKDQILYQMDSEDIQRNITKQQRSVEKAQMNYNEALESVADLDVKTDIKGVITNLYVAKGDNVSNGAKIADIVDKDTLVITIPFGADDAKNISRGQSAEVTILNSLTDLEGKVTNVGSGTYVNSYGVEVTDVEIEAANPSAVSEGTVATAVVGDYACYDSAPLEYANTKTILAKASGEVDIINKKKGDAVTAGSTLVKLKSDNSSKAVKEAKLSLDDAKSNLEQLQETKEDATIRSEIDGKVIQKNIKAGEILDSNTSSTMAIIADLSSLKFNISIDELDISKINVGQEVTITADALPGQTFRGSVTNVSIVGSAYQGVTSYPVTVTIENAESTDLIPGMNVEAQIVIDSAENVLRVPVTALKMGNLIIVKDDGTFTDPLDVDMASFMQRGQSNKNSKSGAQNGKSATGNNTGAPSGQNAPVGKGAPAGQGGPSGQGAPSGQGRPAGYGGTPGQGAPSGGDRPEGYGGAPGQDAPSGGGRPAGYGGAPSQGAPSGQAPSSVQSGNAPKATSGTQADNSANSKAPAGGANSGKGSAPGGNVPDRASFTKEMQKQQKERLKGMIESLDIPEGYTVVMVQTGLNDGTYVEIKEIKGSLKEGDTILVPAVVGNVGTQMQGGMYGGGMYGGRMPSGGMSGGRMPTGGMSGGRMPTGGMSGGRMPSGGMSGGMGANRSGASSGGNRAGGGMR